MKVTEKDLRKEVLQFGEPPKLSEDELFVLWFLRAFITDDDPSAAKALVGGSNDKGLDAVLIDTESRTVFLVQGKFRHGIEEASEGRNDLLGFAALAETLFGEAKAFKAYVEGLKPEVEEKLSRARSKVAKDGYRVQMHYVTTGRVAPGLSKEAGQVARLAASNVALHITTGKLALQLLSDYLDGVAPPVPMLELEIETGHSTSGGGVLQRHDSKTGIESWVFSMEDHSVAEIYRSAGIRVFARNVRGYLGSSEINQGMEQTLSKEPQHFWYFNNGITIVCDDAERRTRDGRDILQVTNPQIINGQQTTRTLAKEAAKGRGASVVVRVIRVPREEFKGTDKFETLVSQIVAATNWQNAIRPSDLMSNDRRQIEIERQFRKLGYQYLRKRQTKSEASRFGGHTDFSIKKEELAQAVAACELDPVVVRLGKEGLFEDRQYARVFPNSDPLYYLPRYWVMHEVAYAARGKPDRSYAKWVVLNFVWGLLRPQLHSRAMLDAFRRIGEHQGKHMDILRALYKLNDGVFAAALTFYRQKRGKGASALDVSNFFKRHGRGDQFRAFWSSGKNRHRAKVSKQLKKVVAGVKQVASAA